MVSSRSSATGINSQQCVTATMLMNSVILTTVVGKQYV